MSHPREINLQGRLANTFGYVGFEELAIKIISYLAQDEYQHIPECSTLYYGPPGLGWKKRFTLSQLDADPTCFAMFCAAGWVNNYWFPKGSFTVNDEFIKKVEEKWLHT